MTWIMSTSTADTWWGASCRRVLTVVGIAWAVTGLLAFPAHAQFVDPLTIVPVLASSIQQPPLANSIADDVVQTFLQKLILKKDGTIDESFVKRLGFVSSSEIINPSALTSAQQVAPRDKSREDRVGEIRLCSHDSAEFSYGNR